MDRSYTNLEQVTLKRSQLYTNKGTPLPDWGNFFIELGRLVAECETGSNRLVVALAIPTRAYAAALTAFGMVITRATLSNYQLQNNNEYFKWLCNLPEGKPVTFFNTDKKFKGFYEGVDTSTDQRLLRIRVESRQTGGLTHLVRLEDAHNIEIRTTPIQNLPKKQNGRKITAHSQFLESILGHKIASKYSHKSQFNCVIIGKLNFLNNEITQTYFAKTPSFQEVGVLQNVLRVRNFLSTENQAYRSDVFSVTARKRYHLSDETIPFMTIFDGASSFIKWRDDWRSSHWTILLDRTEVHFQEAVDIVNQDYINRVNEAKIQNLSFFPTGVELVSYQEVR